MHVARGAPTSAMAWSSSALQASAESGAISDGFQITLSPHTSASAVFHDQTASGEVERRDHGDDAGGVPGLHQAVAGSLGRHRAALELTGEADGEVADVDHLLHLAERLGADLAHLELDEVGEVVLVLLEQATEPPDDRAADRGGHGPPLEERVVGSLHGRAHVGRIRTGAAHQRLPSIGERADHACPGGTMAPHDSRAACARVSNWS